MLGYYYLLGRRILVLRILGRRILGRRILRVVHDLEFRRVLLYFINFVD